MMKISGQMEPNACPKPLKYLFKITSKNASGNNGETEGGDHAMEDPPLEPVTPISGNPGCEAYIYIYKVYTYIVKLIVHSNIMFVTTIARSQSAFCPSFLQRNG